MGDMAHHAQTIDDTNCYAQADKHTTMYGSVLVESVLSLLELGMAWNQPDPLSALIINVCLFHYAFFINLYLLQCLNMCIR